MNSAFFLRRVIMPIVLMALIAARPTPGPAADTAAESPGTIAAKLQERYDAMRSLSFTFAQSTEGQMAGRPRRGNGKAVFLRTGGSKRMRWDYDSPEKQVLVSDGILFSMYIENLNQMIISPAEAIEEDMTYAFFTGSGKLVDDFSILGPNTNIVEGSKEPNVRIIQLIPKSPESQVQDIHLWITADWLIDRIEIRDQFDTRTTLTLSDIQANILDGEDEKALSARFSFTPPEGTEIIHQNE